MLLPQSIYESATKNVQFVFRTKLFTHASGYICSKNNMNVLSSTFLNWLRKQHHFIKLINFQRKTRFIAFNCILTNSLRIVPKEFMPDCYRYICILGIKLICSILENRGFMIPKSVNGLKQRRVFDFVYIYWKENNSKIVQS